VQIRYYKVHINYTVLHWHGIIGRTYDSTRTVYVTKAKTAMIDNRAINLVIFAVRDWCEDTWSVVIQVAVFRILNVEGGATGIVVTVK